MASKFWQSLAKFAPTIATAIGTAAGGPVGPVAGWAVQALEQALGIDTGSTEDQQAIALSTATPDQILALKKADQDFQVKLQQMDIDLEKIGADDRASARSMQIANKDWIPGTLAVTVTVGFFSLLFFMAFNQVSDNQVLVAMTGSLGTVWITIISFYFGSSQSSHGKDVTIAKLSK
jgi:hypothetical protein